MLKDRVVSHRPQSEIGRLWARQPPKLCLQLLILAHRAPPLTYLHHDLNGGTIEQIQKQSCAAAYLPNLTSQPIRLAICLNLAFGAWNGEEMCARALGIGEGAR